MKYPKISIVIPSFNKGARIEETLNSIFNQKYKNVEVIVMDGGSTDNTVDILKKFSKNYKNLKWQSKKDNGQLDAINKGLKKATGDIVSFINADDLYEKNSFNLIVQAFAKNPDALWFAGKGVVINNNGHEIVRFVSWYKNILLRLNAYYMLLATSYLMQPSVFITKKAYFKYGPFIGTKNFVMEYDLWLKLYKISKPVIINKILSKFRIEKGTKTKTMYKSLLKEDKKIVKKYTDNPFILLLHDLHNLARIMVEKFV